MEIETKINTSSVKRSSEDELEQFFKKIMFTMCFNQFLLVITHKWLYCRLAILHKFTWHLIYLQNTPWFLRSEWTTEEWF